MRVYYRLLFVLAILMYRFGNRLATAGFDLRNFALRGLKPLLLGNRKTDAIARQMLGLKPTENVDDVLRGMFK